MQFLLPQNKAITIGRRIFKLKWISTPNPPIIAAGPGWRWATERKEYDSFLPRARVFDQSDTSSTMMNGTRAFL